MLTGESPGQLDKITVGDLQSINNFITCMEHSHPGEVTIHQATSCYGNQTLEPLGSEKGFTFYKMFIDRGQYTYM